MSKAKIAMKRELQRIKTKAKLATKRELQQKKALRQNY
jgi:hypothetical protein